MMAFFFDHDNTGKDEPLGRATVEVFGVTQKGQVDTWVALEEAKTGIVHLRMTWLQLSDNLADLKEAIAETQMLRVTSMSTCILMVFVDSAKYLPKAGGKSGGAQPDPMFHISVAKTTHQSNIQYRTDCPVYEQGFTFLVNNPEVDTLHMKFTDQKTGTEIGKFSYNLSSLLDKENLELKDQPLQIKNAGPESKVILSMRLRVLKYRGGTSSKDLDEISVFGEEITTAPVQLVREASLKKQDSTSTKSDEGTPEHKLFEPLEPVEDLMIATEAPPRVESAPPMTLHHRQPSTTSSTDDSSLGKIQLTLRYSVQRQRLIIIVHKIANLPLKDPNNIPDPYVKLYLLPERSKESKRKTETIKDNCNPIYDETFEYIMSQGELSNRQLEVTVLTQKTWKSPVMGQVIVNLCELDLTKALTSWFDLQPEILKEKEQ